MAKNKKIVRYRKPFHLNIGLIIFGIILIYLMFYIYSYFTSTHISVYEVIYGTIAVNNSYTGLALRSEEIVLAEHAGEINYYRKEASKAGIGDLIYSIDSDGSIAGAINSAGEDTTSLNKESLEHLEKEISEYSNSYQSNAFYQIYTFKDDINAEISEALSMGALNSITDTVSAAENNATFHKGTSPKDSIVVYYTDGYEDVTAETFAPEMLDESLYSKVNLRDKKRIETGEAACKLITDENWEIVFAVTEEKAKQMEGASTVRIRFKKDNTVTRVPFTLTERDGEFYMILSLSHSMIRFAADRYIELELLFEEETGLKIPNSAITTKDFYTVPMEYFQKGNNSNEEGIMIRKTDKNGKTEDSFVTPNIYFATEYSYYVDGEELTDGIEVLKPNSNQTYTIHETAKLEGIYCINKGYAVFRRIDVIYQTEEYAIIRSGTEYGVSLYDHIALDGSTVTENVIVNK